MSATDKLRAHGDSAGLAHGKPASMNDILEFEQKHRVHLPSDFREYLVTLNGLDRKNEQDKNGFSFWPLSRIRNVPGENLQHKSPPQPQFPDWENFFVFADYMVWCWAYAINLAPAGQGGDVVAIGYSPPRRVAESFPEFVDCYLADSERLYPRSD